jgi:hypothetical protein
MLYTFDFDWLYTFRVMGAFEFGYENIPHGPYLHVEDDVLEPRELLLALDGTLAQLGLDELRAVPIYSHF